MKACGAALAVAMFVIAGCKRAPPQHVAIGSADTAKIGYRATIIIDDAKIDLDRGGAYDRVCPNGERLADKRGSGGCADHHFYVFPLVPTASADGSITAVTAWATCDIDNKETKSLETCRTRLAKEGLALNGEVMVRFDPADLERSGWDKAIDNAKKTHGLQSPKNSPVLMLDK